MFLSEATVCEEAPVLCSRTLYTVVGVFDVPASNYDAISQLVRRPAERTLWPHISWACVPESLKAYIDYYHLQRAPCITELSLRIKFCPNNWVHSRVNVKLFASHSRAAVFFSISLIYQSNSSRLCANSYWIFIKTPTNSNGCASGVALKINLLNSSKLPP